MTPSARSRAELISRGYLVGTVEMWVPGANVRRDLFGFADLVAIRVGCPILAVQVTTGSHLSNRVAKVVASPGARTWYETGGRIEVHGWIAPSPRFRRWRLTIRSVVFD